jgi:hypothetical protein
MSLSVIYLLAPKALPHAAALRAMAGIDFFNWTARNVFVKVNTSVAARLQRCQDQIFLAWTPASSTSLS